MIHKANKTIHVQNLISILHILLILALHMIVRCLIIYLAITFLTGCKSANDFLIESNQLADKGNYKEAITLLDKAIKKNPKFKEAYLNRGLCNEYLKNYKAAIKDYENLLKIDPNNTSAFYNIGTCNYDLDLFKEAVEQYNEALLSKGYPADNDTSGNPGIVIDWNKSGIFENDKAKFDIPGDEIFYQRGLAYYNMSKYKSAYRDFYNCLNHNYYPGYCHFMIAQCFFNSGKKEKGCEELDKAIIAGDTAALRQKKEICK